MIILPAIDLLDGRCVRLRQGDFATSREVAGDPVKTAASFKEAGATWIHIVDLNGARGDKQINRDIILKIAAQSGLRVQTGGGVRDIDTVEYLLSSGVARVVIGTAAVTRPELVGEAAAQFGSDRIAVGIDAVEGFLKINGWLEEAKLDYLSAAARVSDLGAGVIIFTDISRDGELNGPNLRQLEALINTVSCPVIASGGVRDIEDLRALTNIGASGVICGKSIYTGDLDLREAYRIYGSGVI